MNARAADTSPYDAGTFEEFWPHYVQMHTRRETHLFHAAGTLSAAVLVGLALARRSPLLLLAAPLCDYALAQASHRLFERNVTRPWKNHAWHARAELRMLRLVLTGRMAPEVERVERELARTRSKNCTEPVRPLRVRSDALHSD
jgi:hypothetical protein